VVIRVFRLEDHPNLKVCTDTWTMFDKGELVLTVNGYTVKDNDGRCE
jgi:hypothetical protein